ncbi:hypothetical protein LJR175_008400 [Variovorax sp. LjRoot175]|uniref:hypothetical protein n=1 Tax=Variovorax sp. LjRoot175 TaxID=3342276 RepID=UPI003ED159EA
MTDRSEVREEIKLRLEKWKFAVSILGIFAIGFAGLQWQNQSDQLEVANRNALQGVYQKISSVWSDHVGLLIDRPKLRPYFTSNVALPQGEEDAQAVLAFGDARLEAMDAILTYAYMQGGLGQIDGWKVPF